MKKTDIAIIGAGPVGLFMAFQAGMLGMKCAILDSLDYIGGQCGALYPEKPIYDIPAFNKILSRDLVQNLYEQAKVFNPEFLLGSPVVELKRNDASFVLINAAKDELEAKAVVIAAGSGEFDFKKPPIAGIENYEGESVFYSINEVAKFKNKQLVISGGGDSAVDWAIELANYAHHIHFIHRRDKFRCLDASYKKLLDLRDSGKITFHIPYQLENIIEVDGTMQRVVIVDLDGNRKELETDFLLPFYGLATNLDKIRDWGIKFDQHCIMVDHGTMMTNIHGVYAIGDVSSYPGKLKLILTGFAEAAVAAHNAYNLVFPNEVLHFEHSTTKGINELGN